MWTRLGKYAVPALAVLGFALTLLLTFPRTPDAVGTRAASRPAASAGPVRPAAAVDRNIAAQPSEPTKPADRAVAKNEEPRPAALPVRLSFPFPVSSRASRTIVLVATGDDPLALDVTIANGETGKQLEQMVALNPPRRVQLGRNENFEPESGDRVTVHADGHADLIGLVP